VTDSGREASFAALVDALIALRRDPATERFDEYLDAAEATARIDEHSARALRWWQRQSLRGLADHIEEILPDLLVRLEQADAAAIAAVDESQAAWHAAAAQLADEHVHPETPAAANSDDRARAGDGAHDGASADANASAGAGAGAGADDAADDSARSGARDSAAPAEIPSHYSEYPTEVMESHRPDVGAPDQRTFVAGLTVLPDGFREQ